MADLKLGSTSKRLDADAIDAGVEKECPYRAGFKARIRPAASFNPHMRKKLRQLRDDREEGDAALDVFEMMEDPEFLVDAVVAWMGPITNGSGKEIEYTREIGLQVLNDPGHADVKDWIVVEGRRYGEFYVEEVQKDEGNSGTGSSGKAAGAGRSKKTKK